MRNFKFLLLVIIVGTFTVNAQIITKKKDTVSVRTDRTIDPLIKKTDIKVLKPVQVNLNAPDLQIMSFTIIENARQEFSDSFKFPFTVVYTNAGNADITENYCDLTFQFYSEAHEWGGHNAPGVNCKKVTATLGAGQSKSVSGILTVMKYQMSNQDLRVRAYIDAACSVEFPQAWGQVKEKDETNNSSDEILLTGGFHPTIGSITPNKSIRGSEEVLMMGGMGFGHTPGDNAVVLKNGDNKVAAQITDWHDGVIYFTIPDNTTIGLNEVYIGNATYLYKYPTSNVVSLNVLNQKVLAWDDLIFTYWDTFKNDFKLKLNTYGGGSTYENTSFLKLLDTTYIDVPLIQFNAAGLKYRSLVRNLDAQKGGIMLTKERCNANQLRMLVSFESSGKEIKTYNRALIKGAKWCDGCVADIHIDNGVMDILFTFTANGNTMDFTLDTNFSADVNASNAFSDAMMNLFLGNWNEDVRKKINKGVKDGLLDPENKAYILSELKNMIHLVLGLTNKNIVQYEFKNTGIHVTYY